MTGLCGGAPAERAANNVPADVVLILTLREGSVVEVWQREGRTGLELAALLRGIADGFARDDVRRIG